MSTEPHDEFSKADFYDASDYAETLVHKTAEDAIVAFFDDCYDPSAPIPIAGLIAEHAPKGLLVTAYRRDRVADLWIRSQALWLAEHVGEEFDEEYGNPDDQTMTNEVLDQLVDAFVSAIKKAVEDSEVWRCTKTVDRLYSLEELEALLRKRCPSWF